jgi:mannose-1-phosphate guanylyltransferase/mannose-6-phosphate isomerase
MSRKLLPKQFLPLASENSLFQDTALRLAGIPDCLPPILVCNQDHRFLVADQMHSLGIRPNTLILEPRGRNTAPAIAVAARVALQLTPGTTLLVLPSDHIVRDVAAFHRAVAAARGAVQGGALATFGIVPTQPSTGYGYIEAGEPIDSTTRRIKRFVEKPDAATAARFLAQGGFLWNSGMFAFSAQVYLDELNRLRPDIAGGAERALAASSRDMDFLRLDAEAFGACPADSVDYAVMEKTDRGVVVPADIGWSDVGSWSSLWEVSEKDADGNVVRGDVHLADSKGCLARSDGRLVSLLGVENLIVVDTDDAVLVAARDRAQEVKEIVDRLERGARTEHVSHRRVYRPWGYYESIDSGERFQVKRIMVKPGEALSLQMHHHRAEHWVVVSGTAKVTRNDEQILLSENESAYIPVGAKHRLENPGKVPLYLIEVQSGGYLGEDDIVRLEDRYKRD